jgi:hypothetical protein
MPARPPLGQARAGKFYTPFDMHAPPEEPDWKDAVAGSLILGGMTLFLIIAFAACLRTP